MGNICLPGEGKYGHKLRGKGVRSAGKNKEVRGRRGDRIGSLSSDSKYKRRGPGEKKWKGKRRIK